MAATIGLLRQVFSDPSLSDAQVIAAAAERFGMNPAAIADEVNYRGGPSGMRAEQGQAAVSGYIGNLQGTGEAVARKLGLTGVADTLGDWRKTREIDAQIATQRARSQGAIDNFFDETDANGNVTSPGVHGAGDLFNYAVGKGIEFAPYIAEGVATGFVGRGAAVGARAALSASKDAFEAARAAGDVAAAAKALQAGQEAAQALKTASRVGLGVGGLPTTVGGVLGAQRAELKAQGLPEENVDLLSAGAGGALVSGMFALSPFGRAAATLESARLPGVVGGTLGLDSLQGVKGGAARMAARGALTGAEQGATMVGMTAANRAFGTDVVNPDKTLTDPEAIRQYQEAFMTGMVPGAIQGSAWRGWRRSEGYKPPVNDTPGASTDLLTTSQGFEPVPEKAAVAPVAGIHETWTHSPGAAGERPRYDTVSPEGLYRSVDEPSPLAATGNRTNPDLQMPAVGFPISADQGGVAGFQGRDADALYGAEHGDPGLVEARRRYLEQKAAAEQHAQEKAAAERAAQEFERRAAVATDAFVDAGPDGKPTMQLKQQDVVLHHNLMELRAAGAITPEQYTAYVGAVKAGLRMGNKSTVNDVRSAVKKLLAAPKVEPAAPTAPAPETVPPPTDAADTPSAGPATAPVPAGPGAAPPAADGAHDGGGAKLPLLSKDRADPRAKEMLGATAPLRALDLAGQLYRLQDAGLAPANEVEHYANGLAQPRPRYAPIEKYIAERSAARPVADAAVDRAAPVVDTQGAAPGGDIAARGGSAVAGVEPDAARRVQTLATEPVSGLAARLPVGVGAAEPHAALTHDEGYARFKGRPVSIEVPVGEGEKSVSRRVEDAAKTLANADERIKKFTELARCLLR